MINKVDKLNASIRLSLIYLKHCLNFGPHVIRPAKKISPESKRELHYIGNFLHIFADAETGLLHRVGMAILSTTNQITLTRLETIYK